MNLLDLPIEILHNISEYLDITSIVQLHIINKYSYRIFRWNILKRLKEYINRCDIKIVFDIESFDIDNIYMLIYILLFIRTNCYNNIKTITVTILKKVGNSNYFAIRDNKCMFFFKEHNFNSNIDRLERCLLSCKIGERFIKSNLNMCDSHSLLDVIYLHRTDYNTIDEEIELNNLNNDLSMVTFHLFL